MERFAGKRMVDVGTHLWSTILLYQKRTLMQTNLLHTPARVTPQHFTVWVGARCRLHTRHRWASIYLPLHCTAVAVVVVVVTTATGATGGARVACRVSTIQHRHDVCNSGCHWRGSRVHGYWEPRLTLTLMLPKQKYSFHDGATTRSLCWIMRPHSHLLASMDTADNYL